MKFFAAAVFAALAVSVKAVDPTPSEKCMTAQQNDAKVVAAVNAAKTSCVSGGVFGNYFTDCDAMATTTPEEQAAKDACSDAALGQCTFETQANYKAFFGTEAAQAAGCCDASSDFMALCPSDEMTCLSNMMADSAVSAALKTAGTECAKAEKQTQFYAECTALPETNDAEKAAKTACTDKADTVCYLAQSTVIADFFKTEAAKPCCNVAKFVDGGACDEPAMDDKAGAENTEGSADGDAAADAAKALAADTKACADALAADTKATEALAKANLDCMKTAQEACKAETDAAKMAECVGTSTAECIKEKAADYVAFFGTDAAKPCCNLAANKAYCEAADDSSSAHAVAVSAAVVLGAALMM